MHICDLCFNDEEMQLAVYNESKVMNICDACGHKSKVVDIDFFSDFFAAVLDLFEPWDDGIDVVSLLQLDWNMFATDEVGHKIISHFLESLGIAYGIDEKVVYSESVRNNFSIWEELKTQVTEKFRFLTSLSSFDDLQLIQHNSIIPENAFLYRARIIPPAKLDLGVNEMGCPPAKITPAGRANPVGIPYLYLCQEEDTCYYEVRALYLDRLAIGTFRVSRDLRILDFTKRLSLYVANTMSTDLALEISKFKLIQRISKDLSKPLRRFDTEIEYVPTQLICEFCKLNNIDGIRFKSSLHEGGVNVVLFDSSCAECVSVKTVEIKHVTIGL